jgi:hypothetical protein
MGAFVQSVVIYLTPFLCTETGTISSAAGVVEANAGLHHSAVVERRRENAVDSSTENSPATIESV